MKILRLLPVAALALAAVSCQNGTGGGLSATSSETDSLMYYLGQMNASEYLREANRDTTLKEVSQKQAYINGVRAGLAALKEGNEAYNKGVMLGIQMADQMIKFSESMDVKINRTSYVGSLSSAVMADTMPNTAVAQSEFRKVMQNIEQAKDEKDKAASRASLKTVAEAAGLPKVSDDLYGKATDTTDGEALTKGDEVTVVTQITKTDGEELRLPLSPKGKIGNNRNFPEPISEAILTLKSGETGEFMTTAYALLGQRAKQMGLERDDVLKITVTPTLVPKAADDENKTEAKAK
ncbi:MAG: hypothetical protein J1D77_02355 [Muribaculaceae bacterium]|nr:hypothetical protein [Muribaculaceae bacterium]